MTRRPDRPVTPWVWLGLAGIAIFYVLTILWLRPVNLFGATQDDTIYFSSAKALAAGRGYILPSLPGTPPATKYPILYPWMLSWVWRWNPSFPGNLRDAIGITVAFGLAYVALAFAFLRRFQEIGDAEALLLTAFCAFHPTVLFYSASVLSDIPFAALALGAMLLADDAVKRDSRAISACSGMVTGLAILLRVLGVPVALGIFAATLARRAWKQAIIFASCAAPALAWLASQAIASARAAMPAGFDSAGPGFQQSWIYYTSYIGDRKLGMVNHHLLGAVLLGQATYLFTDLPGYFLSPLFHKNIPLLFVCTLVVFWMVFAVTIREARRAGWRSVHYALLLTMAMTLAWNYTAVPRFFLPFLPLLSASLWLEGKYWTAQLAAVARAPGPRSERILAASAQIALAALALGIGWNFLANKDRARQRQLSMDRAALLVEKQEAYDWFKRRAPEDARAVAEEDANFYLYTGHPAMTSIVLREAGAYDTTYMYEDLQHMTDVAKAIGAGYWLASSDDGRAWVAARPFVLARLHEIESGLPELFQSSGGHVRIYGLACLQHPDCRPTSNALRPAGRLNAIH